MNCPNHPDAIADLRCSTCGKVRCRDCLVELGGDLLCAECKEEKVRALRSGESDVTAENLASPWRRLFASWVDGVVLWFAVMVVLAIAIALTRGDPEKSVIAVAVVEAFALLSLFLYDWKMVEASGQTLGKKALSIKVVAVNGGDVGSAAWKRAALRLLYTVIPFVVLIDLLMIFGRDRQTLHDRGAKTLVIDWKR